MLNKSKERCPHLHLPHPDLQPDPAPISPGSTRRRMRHFQRPQEGFQSGNLGKILILKVSFWLFCQGCAGSLSSQRGLATAPHGGWSSSPGCRIPAEHPNKQLFPRGHGSWQRLVVSEKRRKIPGKARIPGRRGWAARR